MTRRSSSAWPTNTLLSHCVAERVLEAALAAHRIGTLPRVCSQRGRATRWWLQRFATPLLWLDLSETATKSDHPTNAHAVEIALRWGLAQIRPDGAALDAQIPRHAWLGATPWRAMLAVGCHYGLLTVPPFPDRHLVREQEPAFEQLCALWDVAPSSFYRYVERGRQLLAMELTMPLDAARALTLAQFARDICYAQHALKSQAERRQWHLEKAKALLHEDKPAAVVGAFWHTLQAGDVNGALWQLEHQSTYLAASPITSAMLTTFNSATLSPDQRPAFALAKANVARLHGRADEEQQHLGLALRAAIEQGDPASLGNVYIARGLFNEARDVDRAFADYRNALTCFEEAMAGNPPQDAPGHDGLLRAVLSLAWLYLQRNDPRAQAQLDRADALMAGMDAPVELRAKMQKTRCECYFRQGKLELALECALQAGQLYERGQYPHQLVRTWVVLSMLYGKLQNLDNALQYAEKVYALRAVAQLDPETLAALELNLGVAYFWKNQLGMAIDRYQRAEEIARNAGLNTLVGKAHYNIAEAYFTRFQQAGAVDDELRGDAYARFASTIWEADKDFAMNEATRNLKATVVGDRDHLVYARMLPAELAAHFEPMKRIETQRMRLESAPQVSERIDAQLEIAAAYVRIALEERETAVSLMKAHGLEDQFARKVHALRDTFDMALSHEEQLTHRWIADGTVPREHVPLLVRQLISGQSLTKSIYSKLCDVSPATASKYLSELNHAGLLKRVGAGAATQYVLPKLEAQLRTPS